MMLHACHTTRLRLLHAQTRQVSSSSVKTSSRSPGRLGIHLSRESSPLGVPRFMAIGTAVGAPDADWTPQAVRRPQIGILRDLFVVRSVKRGMMLEEVFEKIGLAKNSYDDARKKYGRLTREAL
jgi:hypothetical protein